MTVEITPALGPDEWLDRAASRAGGDVERHTYLGGEETLRIRAPGGVYSLNHSVHSRPELFHAIAALALYGQPFGFTWDDVDLLRAAEVTAGPRVGFSYARCAALADRIAALLPERDTTP